MATENLEIIADLKNIFINQAGHRVTGKLYQMVFAEMSTPFWSEMRYPTTHEHTPRTWFGKGPDIGRKHDLFLMQLQIHP